MQENLIQMLTFQDIEILNGMPSASRYPDPNPNSIRSLSSRVQFHEKNVFDEFVNL